MRRSAVPSRHLLLASALALSGCSCDEDLIGTDPPGLCEQDYPCEDGFEYRLGACRNSRCQIDADCCPGQACNAAAGFCADQLITCTSDEQCSEKPGQNCIDFRGVKACGYPNLAASQSAVGTQACATDAECALDRSCFNHRCVKEAPCGGGCPPAQVCELDTQTCFDAKAFDSCRIECPDGQMLVLEDPDYMSGPKCCALECSCVTLPPVRGGRIGWYASLALTGDRAVVSAYDEAFGDLVLTSFDEQGAVAAVEYIDGFPSTGAVVGDPNGPRGGRADLGEDVGMHTSAAVDATGVVHIAYHDVDRSALRYANNSGASWHVSDVDLDGVTGLYTSIKLDSEGRPRIAYMMADGVVGADPTKRSALKLASASTAYPSSPSDWSIEVVDSVVKPVPICGGGCAQGSACVDLGAGPACVQTTTGCSGCGANQACVNRSGGPRCEDRISTVPLDDLVEGTGLFASLALTSTSSPLIAYYDRLQGDLRWAYRDAQGTFRTATLDGRKLGNDVGQHASLAIAPNGNPGVAYYDATSEDLVYMDIRSRTREVVDDGASAPDLLLVGADASLLFDEAGRPAIAYQDPTRIDLRYARRLGTPASWSTEVLYGAPAAGTTRGRAAGFYVSQARRGSTAYISNVDVVFSSEGSFLLELRVLKKQLD